jgi:hypothetical protein
MMKNKENIMLYASFNQDFSNFVVGTEKGFKIFKSYPFEDSIDEGKLRKKFYLFHQKKLIINRFRWRNR